MFKTILLALVAVTVLAQQGPQGPPPFLASAPPAKQQEFQKLLENSAGQSDKQIEDKVHAWIAQQDAGIKTAFASFHDQLKADQEKANAAHKAAFAKFSQAAKDADTKLSAIADNVALTGEQKGQQINALLSSLPPNVRAEIETAMQG